MVFSSYRLQAALQGEIRRQLVKGVGIFADFSHSHADWLAS